VLHIRDGFSWEGIEPRPYKAGQGPWRGVTRHELSGDAPAAPWHVRYFEIEPGGHSTHETHAHAHVVLVLRGRGVAVLAGEKIDVGFGDVIHVAPHDPHQFRNPSGEPFGFLCIVPADRDRPTPVEDAEERRSTQEARSGPRRRARTRRRPAR
jgi:quercetin dioxygenase-like cupin family protein